MFIAMLLSIFLFFVIEAYLYSLFIVLLDFNKSYEAQLLLFDNINRNNRKTYRDILLFYYFFAKKTNHLINRYFGLMS